MFLLLSTSIVLAQDDDNDDERERLRITPDGEVVQPDSDFAWAITRYTGSDIEDVTDQISNDLRNGNHVPVGLEADPDLAVLMVRSDEIEFSNWMIYEFDDADELEAEFNGFLTEGWVPMDIARTRNGIAALFIESDIELSGWRLATSQANNEAIEETVSSLIDEGYSVWGQAFDGDGMWHLGVREVGLSEPRENNFETYPDDPEALQEGINEHVSELWVPWALSLARDRILIGYMR